MIWTHRLSKNNNLRAFGGAAERFTASHPHGWIAEQVYRAQAQGVRVGPWASPAKCRLKRHKKLQRDAKRHPKELERDTKWLERDAALCVIICPWKSMKQPFSWIAFICPILHLGSPTVHISFQSDSKSVPLVDLSWMLNFLESRMEAQLHNKSRRTNSVCWRRYNFLSV